MFVTEEEMKGMKWLEEKVEESGMMDTYIYLILTINIFSVPYEDGVVAPAMITDPSTACFAENAESESVRLGATRDLLDRAGFRPVDRHEIVKEKSVKELNAQLVSLVGENGAELLVSAIRSRRSISGPELTK
tara:strand:- start:280 stop:678 length:399 start_codon:yes stop_codon:yes gene_type:complete